MHHINGFVNRSAIFSLVEIWDTVSFTELTYLRVLKYRKSRWRLPMEVVGLLLFASLLSYRSRKGKAALGTHKRQLVPYDCGVIRFLEMIHHRRHTIDQGFSVLQPQYHILQQTRFQVRVF